jgi:hypothetical protein
LVDGAIVAVLQNDEPSIWHHNCGGACQELRHIARVAGVVLCGSRYVPSAAKSLFLI